MTRDTGFIISKKQEFSQAFSDVLDSRTKAAHPSATTTELAKTYKVQVTVKNGSMLRKEAEPKIKQDKADFEEQVRGRIQKWGV